MEISQKREIDKTILFLLTFFEYASQNTAAVSIDIQDYFAFNNFKSLEEKNLEVCSWKTTLNFGIPITMKFKICT